MSDSKKVFVAGLPYETTREQLAALIRPYGRVLDAKIIFDRGTGKSKGFGFVEMSSEDEARAVIRQLDGSYVGTRKLFVNEYKPSPKGTTGAGPGAGAPRFEPRPAAPGPVPGPPGGVERRSGADRRKNPGFGAPVGERRELKKPWEKKPWEKKPWSKDAKPGFGGKKPYGKKPFGKKPFGKKPGGFRKPGPPQG